MRTSQTVELSLAVKNSQPRTRLGEQLREAREQVGWSIEEVAEQLCLNPARIEDLEQDQYGNMAGSTYARGYLQNYARLLKLDNDEVMRRYEQLQDVPEGRQAAPLIEPMIEGNLPHHRDSAARYIGLLLVLALLMVGGWWWQSHRVTSEGVDNTTALDQPSAAAVIIAAEPGTRTEQNSTAPVDVTDPVTLDSADDLAAEAVSAAEQAVTAPGKTSIASAATNPAVAAAADVNTAASGRRNGASTSQTGQETRQKPAPASANKAQKLSATAAVGNNNKATARANSQKTIKKSAKAQSTAPPASSLAKTGRKQAHSSRQPKKAAVVATRGSKSKKSTNMNTATGSEQLAIKTTKKIPRLQLSDDYRTLMLYFDLGSWVDVRDATGKRLMNRMVVQGRTLSVQGTPPFKIFLGNRQGVRIMYRGKPVQIQDNGTGMFARFVVGKPLSTAAR